MNSRQAFVAVIALFATLLVLQQALDPAAPPHEYRDPRTVAAKPSPELLAITPDERDGEAASPIRTEVVVRELVHQENAPHVALRRSQSRRTSAVKGR